MAIFCLDSLQSAALMMETPPGKRAVVRISKRAWIIAGSVFAVLALAVVVALVAMRGTVQKIIRDQTVAYLQNRFHSAVEIKDFYVSLRPGVHVVVTGVVLRFNGRTDIPPLIAIRRVTLNASLIKLFGKKINVSNVYLEGLEIHTPPRGSGGQPLIHSTDTDLTAKYPVVIDQVIAGDAILVPLPKDPTKTPRPFLLQYIEVHNFRFDQPAEFHAILTNPVPRGEIDAVGEFGPWQAEEPSATPVDAKFTFTHADFRTLKGLTGFLSSKGTFKGPLDYLQVEGETDMGDFALRTASHPMPLHTRVLGHCGRDERQRDPQECCGDVLEHDHRRARRGGRSNEDERTHDQSGRRFKQGTHRGSAAAHRKDRRAGDDRHGKSESEDPDPRGRRRPHRAHVAQWAVCDWRHPIHEP